jgi:type III secretion protein L
MDPFVRLTHHPLAFAPGTRLLKGADYRAFVAAQKILEEAHCEADELRAEAGLEHARGYQRGYDEGLAATQLENATQMFETVERTLGYLGRMEHQVVDLVMTAVRKILGEFDDIELTRRIVSQALQVVRNQPQVSIRVSPSQADQLTKRVNALLAGHTHLRLVDVVPDPRLSEGGCILETEIGVVDASLETQLAALERALRSRL